MKQKFANALSLALIMSMFFTSIGLADQFTPDNDVFTPGNQNNVNLSAAPGAPITTSAQLFVEYQGSRHLVPNTTVNFSVNTSQTNLPSGYTVSSVSNTVPGNWNDNSDQFVAGTSNISFTAPSAGSYTYTVKWNDTDSCSSGDCLTQTGAFTINLTVTAPLNTEPSLGLPSNIVTEATSATGAVVTYSATSTDAEDDPDPTPSCVPASGSTFSLGSTTVNCSVTDSGGKSATGSFTVTVEDKTAPALSLPSTITAEATSGSGAAVSYTASATDLVDGSVTINCSPASGATFPLGNNTVSCSASDSRNNSASSSFSIVVADTTGPDLSLPPILQKKPRVRQAMRSRILPLPPML